MKIIEKLDITLAKGLAILLVVVGHILAGGTSLGNEWFSTLIDYLYLFHMPFFIFISGYVSFRPGRLERLSQNYLPYIGNQAVRLLLPFFFIGAMIVFGKIVMQNIVHVDNVPDNPFQGFIDLIWHTKNSPSVFLWYIFAIFIYGAISPLLFKVLGNKMILWVLLGAIISMIPPTYYFYLDKLTLFFVFFCLGGAAIHNEEKYIKLIGNIKLFSLFSALFLASFLLFQYELIDHKFSKLITGSLCIPVLHQICIYALKYKGKVMDAFLFMGRRSYSIYLFNTICIGVTKGVIFLIMDWHGTHFYVVGPVLVASGVLGPLIGEWLVLIRIPFIKIRILGIKT